MMPYHCSHHMPLVTSPQDPLLVALIIYDLISVDKALLGAFYRGIYASTNLTSAIDVKCDTGNCTWPVFASLGACSSCQDVTADSMVVDNGDSVKVPGGQTLTFILPGDGWEAIKTFTTNITSANKQERTANILTLALGQLKESPSLLTPTNISNSKTFHCSLDFCIKRFVNFAMVRFTAGI